MARISRRGAIADAYQTPAGGGAAALVQQASGGTGGTPAASVAATLPGASTAGRALLLVVTSDATVSTPSGWDLVASRVNINGHYLFSKTSAGETSVTVNPSASAATVWWIAEYSGLDISAPLEVITADVSGTPSSLSTGTTGTTSGATDGLAVAAWGSSKFSAAVTTTAMTNSFVEQADVTTTSASRIQLAIGTRTPTADGTFESTETLSAFVNAIGAILAVYAPT